MRVMDFHAKIQDLLISLLLSIHTVVDHRVSAARRAALIAARGRGHRGSLSGAGLAGLTHDGLELRAL